MSARLVKFLGVYGVAPLLALSLVAPVAHAAVVTNGDFETGDLSGWTTSGDTGAFGVTTGIAHTGNFGAYFGPDPVGTISQTLATEAGKTYVIDFWLSLDDSARPNAFSWSWAGVVQASLVDSAGFGYQQIHRLLVAPTASTTLSFSFTNPQSFWLLDSVTAAVPEPGSSVLVGLGLLGLAWSRRRKDAR